MCKREVNTNAAGAGRLTPAEVIKSAKSGGHSSIKSNVPTVGGTKHRVLKALRIVEEHVDLAGLTILHWGCSRARLS